MRHYLEMRKLVQMLCLFNGLRLKVTFAAFKGIMCINQRQELHSAQVSALGEYTQLLNVIDIIIL